MVEGPSTDAAFAIVFIVLGGLIAVGLAVMVRGLLTEYSLWGEAAECTASRDANITASISQTRRHTIVIPIPAESIISIPAGTDYAVPRPCDVDAIIANSVTYNLASLTAPAVPELPPAVEVEVPAAVLVVESQEEQGIPVQDWPMQVVRPVPLNQRLYEQQ